MSTVKLKRSATASKIPLTTDLDLGEIAINTFDGKLFIKKNDGTDSIVEIGAGGGGGGSQAWILKSANYTAVSGDRIIANTTAASFTITLPATPTTGAYVQITDGGNWSVNNLLIDRNGSTIEGIADTLAIDLAQATVELIYDGTTWQFTA